MPGTMTSLLCPKCDQKFRGRGVLPKKLGRGVRHANLKPLPYFRPKYVIFPTLFQTEALEPGGCPERVTSYYGTYTVVGGNGLIAK